MCGRFVFKDYLQYIDLTRWHWDGPGEPPWPSYNIAPTDLAPVVTNENSSELKAFTWWLYPHWRNDGSHNFNTFNARAEGLANSKLYGEPFRQRRCIVLASGWFEWTGPKNNRQPHYITVSDRSIVPFAGLWNRSQIVDKEAERDEYVNCCTIITTAAHPKLEELHERMPVILSENDLDLWLSPEEIVPQDVMHLLQSRESDSFDSYRVGKIVGDSEQNIRPIT